MSEKEIEHSETDEQIEGDRHIPSVNESNGTKNTAIIIIGVVIAIIVLILSWPKSKKEAPVLETKTEEDFNRENITDLKIPELPDDPAPLPQVQQEVVSIKENEPSVPELSQEEQARLRAIQDLRERRKRSPLVVYDTLSRKVNSTAGNEYDPTQAQQTALLENIAAGNTNSQGTDLDTINGQLQNAAVPRVNASYLNDRPYVIAQGKMIGAVIETAISSDLPGMTRAIVSESVYSEDGRNLLIEKGSRIIGEYRAGLVRGTARIFVIWRRIITPYGIDIQITSPGTGSLGRAGHAGWVDSHFLERYGSSILLSLIGAAGAQSSDDEVNVEIGDSFNDSAEIALENSINIRPTLHKNQGDKIKIFVARDINFKPVLALRKQ